MMHAMLHPTLDFSDIATFVNIVLVVYLVLIVAGLIWVLGQARK